MLSYSCYSSNILRVDVEGDSSLVSWETVTTTVESILERKIHSIQYSLFSLDFGLCWCLYFLSMLYCFHLLMINPMQLRDVGITWGYTSYTTHLVHLSFYRERKEDEPWENKTRTILWFFSCESFSLVLYVYLPDLENFTASSDMPCHRYSSCFSHVSSSTPLALHLYFMLTCSVMYSGLRIHFLLLKHDMKIETTISTSQIHVLSIAFQISNMSFPFRFLREWHPQQECIQIPILRVMAAKKAKKLVDSIMSSKLDHFFSSMASYRLCKACLFQ